MLIEPLLQFNRQCEQAIELYEKAFGAEPTYLSRYSDANPQDLPPNADIKKDMDLIFHSQMMMASSVFCYGIIP
ncbi:MAG: hypothetical protein FWE34_00590 [Defluviitaleaceae bacterium]|nr:hypothetical protein [Defluviitaleaceae bacterium]